LVAWVHAEKISAELAIPQRIEVRTFRMLSGLSTLDAVCFFRTRLVNIDVREPVEVRTVRRLTRSKRSKKVTPHER
jgi:hypothetical protein